MPQPTTAPGVAVYSRSVLFIYDIWVLGIANKFLWRCSTSKIQLPFFKQYLSAKHLDIGVGTGYYLSHSSLTSENQITLLDLSANNLEVANAAIGKAKTIQHDALTPLPFSENEKFESVSAFYLLHCLPGPLERKIVLFQRVREVLSDSGTFYGTTTLGKGVKHSLFGRYFIWAFNRSGTFHNRGDDEEGFEKSLRENFEEVKVWVVGVVLMFVAKRPKRSVDLGGNVVRRLLDVFDTGEGALLENRLALSPAY